MNDTEKLMIARMDRIEQKLDKLSENLVKVKVEVSQKRRPLTVKEWSIISGIVTVICTCITAVTTQIFKN